jgi:hypothetical protein
MMADDPLREQLKLIAQILQPYGINLIVGGGYGLLLRTEQIQQSGARTRFAELSGARSTEDLDFFLSAEVITDAEKFIKIREALDKLGYQIIESAKYYQFVLPIQYGGLSRNVKIDLLAAPIKGERLALVSQDNRRIKPRGTTGLHAHTTPEALTVEEYVFPINLNNEEIPLVVYLPHPFSYLLMKLFALRDRLEDSRKGPYHAFDIYRIIGLMTDTDWEIACSLRDQHLKTEPVVQEACELVKRLFSNLESPGMIQIRIYARNLGEEIPEKNLIDLLNDLQELLPSENLQASSLA